MKKKIEAATKVVITNELCDEEENSDKEEKKLEKEDEYKDKEFENNVV